MLLPDGLPVSSETPRTLLSHPEEFALLGSLPIQADNTIEAPHFNTDNPAVRIAAFGMLSSLYTEADTQPLHPVLASLDEALIERLPKQRQTLGSLALFQTMDGYHAEVLTDPAAQQAGEQLAREIHHEFFRPSSYYYFSHTPNRTFTDARQCLAQEANQLPIGRPQQLEANINHLVRHLILERAPEGDALRDLLGLPSLDTQFSAAA